MLAKMAHTIAEQKGISLTKVSLVEGHRLGCSDTSLLNLSAKGHVVSALIFQKDIESLHEGNSVDRLELRIHAALARLHMLLVPEQGQNSSTVEGA